MRINNNTNNQPNFGMARLSVGRRGSKFATFIWGSEKLSGANPIPDSKHLFALPFSHIHSVGRPLELVSHDIALGYRTIVENIRLVATGNIKTGSHVIVGDTLSAKGTVLGQKNYSGGNVVVKGNLTVGSGTTTSVNRSLEGDIEIQPGANTKSNSAGGSISITGPRTYTTNNTANNRISVHGASVGENSARSIDLTNSTATKNFAGQEITIRNSVTRVNIASGDIRIVNNSSTGANGAGGDILVENHSTTRSNNAGKTITIVNSETGSNCGHDINITNGITQNNRAIGTITTCDSLTGKNTAPFVIDNTQV